MLELELEEDKILNKRKNVHPDKCYKCGRIGHRATNCRDVNVVNNNNNNQMNQ